MSTPLDVIDAEIKANEDKIASLEIEISMSQTEIESLRLEIGFLNSIRPKIASAVAQPAQTTQAKPISNGKQEGFGLLPAKKLRPSKAILRFLGRSGEKDAEKEIVEALKDEVLSKSDNKELLLTQTLGYLVKNDSIIKRGDKYRLAKS